MSKYRTTVAVLLLVLVVPVWAAGASAAWCPLAMSQSHQCCMSDETSRPCAISPDGNMVKFVQCHCGDTAIPPAVTNQGQSALSHASWTTPAPVGLSDWDQALVASRLADATAPSQPSPQGAPFLLHCAFLI